MLVFVQPYSYIMEHNSMNDFVSMYTFYVLFLCIVAREVLLISKWFYQ